MTKRKNIFDDDNDRVLNVFDRYPFITRSIQASEYMQINPIQYKSYMNNFDNISIFKHIEQYIINIFKLFFSNCGMSYQEENYKLTNEEFEIMIYTTMYDEKAEAHLGLLKSTLFDVIINFSKMFTDRYFYPSIGFEWKNIDISVNEVTKKDYDHNIRFLAVGDDFVPDMNTVHF